MHPTENAKEYENFSQEYILWHVTLMLGIGAQNKNVFAFGGFVSATGKDFPRKSTIDYFTPINQPFTDCATQRSSLGNQKKLPKEVGQNYVLNTFDMG